MAQAAISNLKDWRKLRTRQLLLGCGLTVTLRRDVNVFDLVSQGTIPLPLIQKLSTLGNLSGSEVFGQLGEDLAPLLAAVDAVAVAAVASPAVLNAEAYTALLAECAEALSTTPTAIADWLIADGGEAHLAGLPEALRSRLLNSIAVGELPLDDRLQIFSAASAEAAPAASFPRTA